MGSGSVGGRVGGGELRREREIVDFANIGFD